MKCIEVKKKDLDRERVSQKPNNINLEVERKSYSGGVKEEWKRVAVGKEYLPDNLIWERRFHSGVGTAGLEDIKNQVPDIKYI